MGGGLTSDSSRVRQLLVSAANPTIGDEHLATLLEHVDQARLTELAEYHRVSSMLYHRLRNIDGLGHRTLDQLAAASGAAQARRLHAQRTLRMLHDTLADHPFLLVKGLALAGHWYRDPAEREFNDVDILVRPDDFASVVDSMSSAGFEPLTTNWQGFTSYGVAEVPFRYESSVVDLHWDLVALGRDRRDLMLRTHELFARAETVTVDTTAVLTLDPVDTLLHLCVNAGLDGARTLRAMIDVGTVVRSGRVDFSAFVDRAERAGAARLCSAVLQRARNVLGTPVDADALRRLAPNRSWLPTNTAIDQMGILLQPTRASFAPGLLLCSGRRSAPRTALALARSVAEALTTRAGKPALSAPGGDLDWRRRPADGDVAAQRTAYLDYVAQTDVALRRVR